MSDDTREGAAEAAGLASGDPASTALAKRDARRARQIVWGVRLGLLVLRMLARTWRTRVSNAESYQAMRRDAKPFIFAFWHGTMLPLVWEHRGQGISVLISLHKDGEIVARVCEAMGNRTVRGSSTRGGGRALLGLVRELEAGYEVAVTPDGPKGPLGSYAPGALMAAQRAHVPVIPIAVHCDRAWRLRSWDRFMIPKPFARVSIAYGDPAYVAGTTPREAAEETARFASLLAAAEAEATRAAGA
jgi:lysophospholipid acyltransferase (LPLAT)-like uncharacterized protein